MIFLKPFSCWYLRLDILYLPLYAQLFLQLRYPMLLPIVSSLHLLLVRYLMLLHHVYSLTEIPHLPLQRLDLRLKMILLRSWPHRDCLRSHRYNPLASLLAVFR